MDDSSQDFVELCARPLKRVCRKAEHQSSTQRSAADRRRHKKDVATVTGGQSASTGTVAEPKPPVVSGRFEQDSGDPGASVSAASGVHIGGDIAERGLQAKDKVLLRMQQFKRDIPHKLVHSGDNCIAPPPPRRDSPEPSTSGLHPEPQHSDEALALRLQQELDREAAEAQTVHLEDGGLFFCQLCHRDLSHMSPEGRTQHLNRCLDEIEDSAPAPAPAPPPPPPVPSCPICGKRFKSQKSRSAHLKRCSSDMGVAPAVLLQALQRQAAEAQSDSAVNQPAQTGGSKRKGPPELRVPARKKSRKKALPLDEDTMVALALSTSLLEQEKEAQRELHRETAASHTSIKSRSDAGKGRGKRKKGGAPRPPPLLLVQDAEAAMRRLQERVASLLLRSRAPSPPTPTLRPSSLPAWSGAAPLWQKSALRDEGPQRLSDFYTPELREFIVPWEPAGTDVVSTSKSKPDSSSQPVREGSPVPVTTSSIPPSSSSPSSQRGPSPAPSTPGTGQFPVGSQAFNDLMELAEEGMTLTQWGYTASGPQDKRSSAGPTPDLPLSGFVLEEPEELADPGLPRTTSLHTESSQARRAEGQPGADGERGSHRSVAMSRLASDLGSMVNNPQLSDVQLQVDTGEVYFAHSFMIYARCPLLAQMVHDSGFGVQEEDMPAAQRVLIGDVPGEAVHALLQYLYTAHCPVSASLLLHVLELASRFDLEELRQLCQLHQEEVATQGGGADCPGQEDQRDQAFMELLHSMWSEEEEDDDAGGTGVGGDGETGLKEGGQADNFTSRDGEMCEEHVNEEEMEEIYEFAATQRNREEVKDSTEEGEEEKVDEGDLEMEEDQGFTKPDITEPKRISTGSSLDRSYSRLFSESWGVYEEEEPLSPPSISTSRPPKTQTPLPQQQQHSPHKPSSRTEKRERHSDRTCLQSSASEVIDLSISPPPSTSNLPLPGLSPGAASGGDEGTEVAQDGERPSPKRASQGSRSIRVSRSPAAPQGSEEPELILLSDSSEELEVDRAAVRSHSPSPPSHRYTQIQPKPIPEPNKPISENNASNSAAFSPSASSASPVPGRSGSVCDGLDQTPEDYSPEVSWLIPATPVQSSRSSSSTQTHSSMFRTQLFPRDTTPVFAVPLSQPKGSRPSSSTHPHPLKPQQEASTQGTPLHSLSRPYSSTPLQADLPTPPVLTASPLHRDPEREGSMGRGSGRGLSESPEKKGLGSLRLSSSDPSDSPFSSSHRGPPSSQRESRSSGQCGRSVESDYHDNTSTKPRRMSSGEGQRVVEGGEKSAGTEQEEEMEEAEVFESSFQQSFTAMDDPPMAFNDSWGLDTGADGEVNQGVCFSLRLEDSAGTSQHEHSPGGGETAGSSSPNVSQPPTAVHSFKNHSHGHVTTSPPPKPYATKPSSSISAASKTAHATAQSASEVGSSLLDPNLWDSWDEEEEVLPLTQRVNHNSVAQLKTPVSSRSKSRGALVPVTPMPSYSDMDTPELKNKLNRFGVRPLPKRQMVLKLKEIHQYTHQLVESDSEDEGSSGGRAAQTKPLPPPSTRPVSCAQAVKFKQPRAPPAVSPEKHNNQEDAEPLSSSQDSNTSSTAASEDSQTTNPELCLSADGDSDGDVTASQAVSRHRDRLRAVRSFILSDPELYGQILQYRPLVLSQLQERLKAAGIRLGASKLLDYLDSQCITFTTAKPGHSAPSRRRGKGRGAGKGAKAAGEGKKRGRKRAAVD
ncbi:structure-specific endonuclease subunit SLX4 [Diretmus argenteus]